MQPVEYEVSGNEKDVFHASARLDEYFSGLGQWYSLISSSRYNKFALPVILALLLSHSLAPSLARQLIDDPAPSALGKVGAFERY